LIQIEGTTGNCINTSNNQHIINFCLITHADTDTDIETDSDADTQTSLDTDAAHT